MKFTVTMKDPDTLHDAIDEAVTEDVAKMEGLDEDERQAVIDARKEKVQELCNKWFEYGEYLRVEIDTEAKTCTVLSE
jgi:uncharacterized protein YggE